MKTPYPAFLRMLTIVLLWSPAWGAGSPDQAKALVAEAVAFYKENGKDAALAEFNNKDGSFVQEDLYIFVYDPQGVIIAHGGDATLIGKDFTDVADADGKYFAREFIKVGAEGGWVNYKWNNYTTEQIEEKIAYLQRIDDIIIGCGAYQ